MKDLPRLPPREADANKGDFGRGLLIGGSRGMAGAIAIAAMGTLRGGAGLTTVATADACLGTVAGHHPALMTLPLKSDRQGRIDGSAAVELRRRLRQSDAAAIGPGMGQSLGLRKLILELYRQADLPLVVDADGLNALAKTPDWHRIAPPAPRILTPHPGEFQRLSGVDSHDRPRQEEAAREMCRRENLVIVLKGSQTAVIDRDGCRVNETGNPKMAVGGSGDLLTGIILAMVCQQMAPFDAAVLAVHLHGLAGDLAARRLGCPSVLANDLLDDLPAAFAAMEATA